MKFCTAINCMDGRIQLPVIRYMQKRFDAENVDTITEPGPIKILAEEKDAYQMQSILDRLKISVEVHNSVGAAIIGHYDCAGNPASESEQKNQIKKSVNLLKQKYEKIEIIGLWVDENWEAHEVLVNE